MNPALRLKRLLIVLFLLSLAACADPGQQQSSVEKKVISSPSGDLFDKEAFIQKLSIVLPPVDTLDSLFIRRGVTLKNALAYTYGRAGYHPLWVEEGGVTEAAATLIGELDSLQLDGLNPEQYGAPKLREALERLTHSQPSLEEVIAFDTACTNSYLKASRHLRYGRLSPKGIDDQWFHRNDTVWQAPAALYNDLNTGGKYLSLSSYRSELPTYQLIRKAVQDYQALSSDSSYLAARERITPGMAPGSEPVQTVIKKTLPWAAPEGGDSLDADRQMVRHYQEANGLAANGKLDSITIAFLTRRPDSVLPVLYANLERLRWLPQRFEDQYVVVNVPLMELYFRQGTENAFQMRVVVGKPSRQTPSLNADMANVVFSPPWGVPPTILKQEVIPGIARRGASYLAIKGLKAYDRKGKVVNASAMNAGNLRSYTFRQAPGARNALGEVKFNLPNKWDIYLHDTPHREDFPKRYRAKSSGCIRVERPRDFAEFILNDIEGRRFDQARIDSIIQTRHTRYETLRNKIPVHIVYLTAFEDSSSQHLRLFNDIYHRDAALIAALGE